jgi:hypothetical protein
MHRLVDQLSALLHVVDRAGQPEEGLGLGSIVVLGRNGALAIHAKNPHWQEELLLNPTR